MNQTAVAKLSELPPGQMRAVEASGVRVVLCNVEGRIYAIENLCTHDDGPLGEGMLHGFEAECPRHGGRFDVTSGRPTRMPAVAPVRTFPVRVEGDSIFVELDEYNAGRRNSNDL